MASKSDLARIKRALSQVRDDVIEREDMTPPFGQCDTISRDTAAELAELGVAVRVVKGCFELDWPAPDLFAEAIEGELARFVSHTWLEFAGWLFDGSADQFNDWLESPMPPLLMIERAQATRHHERPALAF